MDIVTDLVGLVLVAAGAFGAGFEFRMMRSQLMRQVLTPAARLFWMYVTVIVCGMIFVSNHWHNAAVTWTFTGLAVVLVIAHGLLVFRSRRERSGYVSRTQRRSRV